MLSPLKLPTARFWPKRLPAALVPPTSVMVKTRTPDPSGLPLVNKGERPENTAIKPASAWPFTSWCGTPTTSSRVARDGHLEEADGQRLAEFGVGLQPVVRRGQGAGVARGGLAQRQLLSAHPRDDVDHAGIGHAGDVFPGNSDRQVGNTVARHVPRGQSGPETIAGLLRPGVRHQRQAALIEGLRRGGQAGGAAIENVDRPGRHARPAGRGSQRLRGADRQVFPAVVVEVPHRQRGAEVAAAAQSLEGAKGAVADEDLVLPGRPDRQVAEAVAIEVAAHHRLAEATVGGHRPAEGGRRHAARQVLRRGTGARATRQRDAAGVRHAAAVLPGNADHHIEESVVGQVRQPHGRPKVVRGASHPC